MSNILDLDQARHFVKMHKNKPASITLEFAIVTDKKEILIFCLFWAFERVIYPNMKLIWISEEDRKNGPEMSEKLLTGT